LGCPTFSPGFGEGWDAAAEELRLSGRPLTNSFFASMITSTSSPPALRVHLPREPMLWAAIAFALGIVAGVYQWRPPLWWIAAGLVFAGATVYFASRHFRFSWMLALSAFILIGAFEVQIRGAATLLDTSIVPYVNGETVDVTGHVVRDGRVHATGQPELRQSLDVEAEKNRLG
jgi:hypothetical protein